MESDNLPIPGPMQETKIKRNEFLVEIRKKKSQSLVQQIRRKHYRNDLDEIGPKILEEDNKQESSLQPEGQIPQVSQEQFESAVELFSTQFFDSLRAEDVDGLVPAVKGLREMIGKRSGFNPGRTIINTGVIEPLIKLLAEDFDKFRDLQTEVAWFFANISAGNGDDVAFLVDQNIIPMLGECLKNKNNNEPDRQELLENVMWTLANIAGEPDLKYRSMVLDHNVLYLVVRILCTTPKRNAFLRTSAWLISNLVRGTPFPVFEKVEKAISMLTHLINNPDPKTVEYSLVSLAHLSEEGHEKNLKAISDNGLIMKVVPYIDSESELVSLYALKAAGNLAKGSKRHASNLCDPDVFMRMAKAVKHPNKEVKKEAVIALSNIFGNEFDDHDYVMEHDIIQTLVIIAGTDEEDELKALATNCIYTFIYDCKFEEAKVALENGFVEAILQNLGSKNVRLIQNSLLALYRVFEHGEALKRDNNGINPLTYTIREKNLTPIIEELLNHPDSDVVTKVGILLDKFFRGGDFNAFNEIEQY